MIISSIDEITQFKTIVEQLEICCDFLEEDSIAKYRVSVILLDNISEILLYRSCDQLFEQDNFLKWIIPQQFPVSKKKRIKNFFDEKINIIKSKQKISKKTSEILHISHKYRNDIYHHDKHNATTIGIIAKILFNAVCDLLAETQCGIGPTTIGGYKEPFDWLSPYGLNTTSVDFLKASTIISKSLKSRIDIKLSEVSLIFCSDIESRIHKIKQLIADELPWKTPAEIDHIIKWFEFQENYPNLEDELSSTYREYVYRIAQGKPIAITPEQLEELKENFQKEYRGKAMEYKQNIAFATIDKVMQEKKDLENVQNIGKALCQYFNLDQALSRLEYYIELAALEWDRIVQREIDLRRGK